MSNKAVTHKFFEIYGRQHDVEGCTPYFASDIIVHTTNYPTPLDFNGYKQLGYAFLTGFPDLAVEVLEEIEAGNKVVTRVAWSGTHQGVLNNIPPTGRRFQTQSIYMDTVENGRIVDRHEVGDMFGMLQQLGVIPAA